ncbi:MAG: hypothetical protein AB9Q19_01320 [Candidatus Reddybacter sp.]
MRTYSTNTESEITKTVTRPLFIIELGFAVVRRLSSRGDVSYNANSYLSETIELNMGGKLLRFFNEGLGFSSVFLTEKTAGISCKIWQLYGDAPFTTGDADLIFDGELGAASVGEWISVNLRQSAAVLVPRLYAKAPTFNHIPADGLEIATPYGLYRMERS